MTTTNLTQPPPAPVVWANRLPGARWFKDLTIGTKLSIGFGLLVLLTLIGAAVSYIASSQATLQINTTQEVRVPTALASARAQANLLRMLGDVRGYLALGESQYRDSYNQARLDFAADLAELKNDRDKLNPENQQRLDELDTTFAAWSKLPETLFELRDDQLEREPAYALLATEGTRSGGGALIALQSMIEAQGSRDPSKENMELLQDLAELQSSFTAMLSGLRGYVTTRNRIYRQEYQVNVDVNKFAWERLINKQALLTSNQRDLLAQVSENRERFLSLPEQMFTILESDRWREDLYLFQAGAVPLAGDMQRLLADLTADQQTLLERDLNRGRQQLAAANRQTLFGGLVALGLALAMSLIFRENIAGPVRRLTNVADRIRHGDLEAQAQVESRDEMGILAETFNNMTGQLRQTLHQVSKEKRRADNLLDVVIPIGVDLTSEKNFNRLLEKMLLEAKTFCHADAGTLYLKRAEDRSLEHVIISNDTLKLAMGGTTGQKITFAPLPLYDAVTGAPNHETIATHVALTGASFNISDAEELVRLRFTGSEVFDDDNHYHAGSHLTLPLKTSTGQVIGVMQLINAQEPETKRVIPFDQNLQQMMESFSSLAVAALEAYVREESLKQEIKQLRIEIDEVRRQNEVQSIVDSESFQDLQAKARELRSRIRRREG